MDNVIEFQKQTEAAENPSEHEVIMQTLSNVMDFQDRLEKGMKLATAVIAELQAHVRDLEYEVSNLKKSQPKKPAILNSQGARVN